MFKAEKEVYKALFDNEEAVIKEIEKSYMQALKEIETKIKILQADEMTQSKIYQINYQKALKAQVEGIIEKLHGDNYTSIQQYLKDCYTDSYVGTMYALHAQGMPVIAPIDQDAAVRAILTDSKINDGLYASLGVDAGKLKTSIRQEIARGLSTGSSWEDIARNISFKSRAPLSRAKTIVRTEGHRVQQASSADARDAAKEQGCDVLKMWDATLDGETRDTHRALDGQIRETDEDFESSSGKKAKFPGDFGDPAEDCNCRCVALTRARWELDASELQTLKDRAKFFGLDKTDSFKDFEKKYLKAAETVEKSGESGIIKMGNVEVRKWYLDSVSHIPDSIDQNLPMVEKAQKAFAARNRIRTEARNRMADEATRKMLDQERPNKTFEELVQSKMERKGMTREEAIEDIYKTATKTNANVNKELGLGD